MSPDSEIVSRHGKAVSSSTYGTTHPETMSYDSSGRLTRQTSPKGEIARTLADDSLVDDEMKSLFAALSD